MEGTKERLRQVMDLFGDNFTDLAKYIGISYQALSKKLNGHVDFKRVEIALIKNRYNLTPEEVDFIFFNEEVIPETSEI